MKLQEIREAWAAGKELQYRKPATQDSLPSFWKDWEHKNRIDLDEFEYQIKPKMCKLAGLEFPQPVGWADRREGDFLVDLNGGTFHELDLDHVENFKKLFREVYYNGTVQRTREGAEQQLKALQKVLGDAICM